MRFVAALGVLCCVLGGLTGCRADEGVPPPDGGGAARTSLPSTGDASPPSNRRHADRLRPALQLLRSWDTRRSRAWAEQDAPALRALYLSGSAAGAADVRLLSAYQRRGLVVRRLQAQVFAARVLHRSNRRLRLLVHDRVSAAIVRGRAGTATLRSSDPSRRVLELRRVGGRWRMASVTEPPGPVTDRVPTPASTLR